MVITSVSNPWIKEVMSIKKRHAFYRNEAFWAEGLKVVLMALGSGAEIKRLFYTADNAAAIDKLNSGAFEVIEVSGHVMDKLTETRTPQGVVAVVHKDVPPLGELVIEGTALVVVCDRVKDPGNCGAIIRTADALGAGAVIVLPRTCNPFSPKVVRATAGSIFNIPVVYASAEGLLSWVRQRGITPVVTTPHAGIAINKADLTIPLALIVGEESAGIDPGLIDRAELSVNIPMIGAAESLNVAACTSICLYEAQRQRRKWL
ncbi:MAG: RNA methyltransferase [Nitrospirae bacterium]|nr:RNA methyltransferase [Nitrospirota bacterium]